MNGFENPNKYSQFVDKASKEQDYLGGGFEKEVYSHPNQEDKVLAIYHKDKQKSPEITRAMFYLHKILNLLYPKNVPSIHLATSSPTSKVVERVYKDAPDGLSMQRLLFQVKKTLFERHIKKLGLFIDRNAINYMESDSVDPVYIDDFYLCLNGNSEKKLRDKINHNLSGAEKERALTYLDRFEELSESFL